MQKCVENLKIESNKYFGIDINKKDKKGLISFRDRMVEKKDKYQGIVILKGVYREINFLNMENNYEQSMSVLKKLPDFLKNDLEKSIDVINNLDDEKTENLFQHGYKTIMSALNSDWKGAFYGAFRALTSFPNDDSDKKKALISEAKREHEVNVRMIGVIEETIKKLKYLTDELEKRIKTKSTVCSLI